MQDLGRRYVRVINTMHGRTGTLWEARYKASLIDSEGYLLTCHKYIELNPVRAGLVGDPGSYPWSSHGYYAAGRPNRFISEHPVYRSLGATEAERRNAFSAFFDTGVDERLTRRIRDAVNTASAFGSETFMAQAEATLGRSVKPPVRGRPPKLLQENCSDPFSAFKHALLVEAGEGAPAGRTCAFNAA